MFTVKKKCSECGSLITTEVAYTYADHNGEPQEVNELHCPECN